MSYESEWQKVYGINRDPVREILIYPQLLYQMGELEKATLVDLGCGNGGLIHRLLDRSFHKAVGLDVSQPFIDAANALISDPRVSFVRTDITESLPLPDASVDCVVSVFVLNEINQLTTVFSECGRILKPHGFGHFVVTHPFLVAQSILHEKYTGRPLGKLDGLMLYKSREPFEYRFTIANVSARYFQHTFEEYVDGVAAAGLTLSRLVEMQTDDPAFQEYEKYWSDREVPKYMYFRIGH